MALNNAYNPQSSGGGGGNTNATIVAPLGAHGAVEVEGVASGTPIPISGTVTATNPSVGVTGAAVPADATYFGGDNGSGNLTGVAIGAHGGVVMEGVASGVPVPISGPNANGQATMANSAPVVIASNQSAVSVSGTVTANAGTGEFASNLNQVNGATHSATNPVFTEINDPTTGTGANVAPGTKAGLVTNQNDAEYTLQNSGTPASGSAIPITVSANSTINPAAQTYIDTQGFSFAVIRVIQFGTSVTAVNILDSPLTASAYQAVVAVNLTAPNATLTNTIAVTTTTYIVPLLNRYLEVTTTGAQTASNTQVSVTLRSGPVPLPVSWLGSNAGVSIGSVVLNAGTNTIGAVTQAVNTSGGVTTIYQNGALSNTAAAIKASAGNVYSIHGFNPNAGVCSILIYNLAAGSVTVGTTVPFDHVDVPGLSGFVMEMLVPDSFSTAIAIACITGQYSASNSTAPGSALSVRVRYN